MVWRRVLCLALGGISFWTLTTILELVTRRELNLAVGTFVPPAALVSAYLFLRKRICLRNAALWMLAGVFLLGPLYWMAGRAAFNGGFALPTGWEDLWWLAVASFFPPLMLMLAGYEGTMFGLLLATIIMIIINVGLERRSARHETANGCDRRETISG